MNPKDIRTSSDPDLAGSYAAMQRAALSAQDLAIRTNTGIVRRLRGRQRSPPNRARSDQDAGARKDSID